MAKVSTYEDARFSRAYETTMTVTARRPKSSIANALMCRWSASWNLITPCAAVKWLHGLCIGAAVPRCRGVAGRLWSLPANMAGAGCPSEHSTAWGHSPQPLVVHEGLRQASLPLLEETDLDQRRPDLKRCLDLGDDVVHEPGEVLLEEVRLEVVERPSEVDAEGAERLHAGGIGRAACRLLAASVQVGDAPQDLDAIVR